MPSITKIAITGGPCAGKTTLVNKAIQELSERGIRVFVVPEAATTLIAGMNIAPGKNISMNEFQEYVMNLQFANEDLVMKAAMRESGPVLILCDRGKLDGLAYAPHTIIRQAIEHHQSNMVEARDSYDAVIHLLTAAIGAEEAYTLANNTARSESLDEAAEKDAAVMKAWIGHSHLHIIGNKSTFENKMEKAVNAILQTMGIPTPVEKERKFLVEMPNLASLKKYNPVMSQIIQTYLTMAGDTERRVRQRGDGENFSFFYTEKTPIDGYMERFEREVKISAQEYAVYLAQADYTNTNPIHKTRYCFPYRGQYFELDLYEKCGSMAIVEIELTDSDAIIELPPELKLIKEVTGDKSYSNYSIACNGGTLPA